jgi:hypothetical protein
MTTIKRAFTRLCTRAWDYAVVAGCCALAMGGCYATGGGASERDAGGFDRGTGGGGGYGGRSVAAGGAGVDGYNGCGGLYGPQPCQSDQYCIDWHDGGDWYCDENYAVGSPPCRQILPTCLPGPEDAGDSNAP